MDKNFKVRSIVTIVLFTVALLALYTFDSIPFKIIFCLFSLTAIIELFSFFRHKVTPLGTALAIIELGLVIGGMYYVITTNLYYFWYIILGVCGYDIFAYTFGKFFGGKVFPKSRPFPHISKNKTWEGTFLGLSMSIGMVAILMAIRGSFYADLIYLFAGPMALVGDLFESYLKRKFDIKDSNEIIIKNKFFEKLELCVGGTAGHGGFLDRVDSTAFTTTLIVLISLIF